MGTIGVKMPILIEGKFVCRSPNISRFYLDDLRQMSFLKRRTWASKVQIYQDGKGDDLRQNVDLILKEGIWVCRSSTIDECSVKGGKFYDVL